MELKAKNEISQLLNKFGDSNPIVLKTKFSGIIKIETILDVSEVIEKLRIKVENEPWEIRYCSRIIPIQKICQTELLLIKKNVIELISFIKPNDTYKISLEKRDSGLIRNHIISNIASLLSNKVSLEAPDCEIIIQIIGDETGISVMPRNSILSISKMKRSG